IGYTYTVSDSADQNNLWTLVNYSVANYPAGAYAFALNTKGGSKDTITVTSSGGGTIGYCIGEYSGVNTLRAASPFTIAVGTSGTYTTPAIATVSGDLLITSAINYYGSVVSTAPVAYSVREYSGTIPTKFSTEFADAISSGGSTTAAWTGLGAYTAPAIAAFYQKSTGVPNSLMLMG